MKTIRQRRFTADEPVVHGQQSPEPHAAAGGGEAPAAPVAGPVDSNDEFREGAAGLPAVLAPFRDVPATVWKLYLSAWAVLFGLFMLFFAVNLAAAFAVTIACLFAVMVFGLPIVLSGLPKDCDGQCGTTVQTPSGPLSLTAAGTQILLIPAAAVFALCAFILLAK